MRYLFLAILLFLSCSSIYTIQKGVIEGGSVQSARFMKLATENDTCIVIDSVDGVYKIRCK